MYRYKKQNMNASKAYSKATIPMLEICTTNNKSYSSGTPTNNILSLLPYRELEKQSYKYTKLEQYRRYVHAHVVKQQIEN